MDTVDGYLKGCSNVDQTYKGDGCVDDNSRRVEFTYFEIS